MRKAKSPTPSRTKTQTPRPAARPTTRVVLSTATTAASVETGLASVTGSEVTVDGVDKVVVDSKLLRSLVAV